MRQAFALVFLCFVVLSGGLAAQAESSSMPTRTRIALESAKGGSATLIDVEVAATPEQIERGLMFRDELPDGMGMLFVFAPARPVMFWMKNTRIPLDMLFIDADGRIKKIAARAVPFDLTPVPSGGPVAYVLEIGGGQAAKLGIAVGDRLQIGVR